MAEKIFPRALMRQINDCKRGIHMVVIPNIKPAAAQAELVIVTSTYHCRCCGAHDRCQISITLCCN